MTRYAKIPFPLQLSSTSSYSNQLLPTDLDASEFTCTKVVENLGATIGPGTAEPYLIEFDFDGWTTIDYVYVRCHDTSTADGMWVGWADPDDVSQYKFILPGQQVLLPNIDPAGDAGSGSALILEIPHTPDLIVTYDLIILGT